MVKDDQGIEYPSREGILSELVNWMEQAGEQGSWYTFKAFGENALKVISYDEAGEPEKFYTVTFVIAERNS